MGCATKTWRNSETAFRGGFRQASPRMNAREREREREREGACVCFVSSVFAFPANERGCVVPRGLRRIVIFKNRGRNRLREGAPSIHLSFSQACIHTPTQKKRRGRARWSTVKKKRRDPCVRGENTYVENSRTPRWLCSYADKRQTEKHVVPKSVSGGVILGVAGGETRACIGVARICVRACFTHLTFSQTKEQGDVGCPHRSNNTKSKQCRKIKKKKHSNSSRSSGPHPYACGARGARSLSFRVMAW